MFLPSNKPGESPKRFSRGQFLRDSVIAASGIILMPSMLSGCKKYVFDHGSGPFKGWGDTPPTITDLQNAAANLERMRIWLNDLYTLSIEYEEAVFLLLDSTKQTEGWAEFIGNIFIDIAVGIAGAIAAATDSGAALAAIACLADILKDWGLGKETPPDLAGTFGEFMIGHNAIQAQMELKLSSLVDKTNNYSNLLNQWTDVIEFNGKSYTLNDLANSNFPDLGDAYNRLQVEAHTHFKKSLWNLVMMKCCTLYSGGPQYIETDARLDAAFYQYAQHTFYPQNKGSYMRGKMEGSDGALQSWMLIPTDLGLGGNPLPDAAAAVLFMDDTPGHIINPDGLFNRSYVFEQFSITKPVLYQHELASYPNLEGKDFSGNDDWDFTGGLFPRLIH